MPRMVWCFFSSIEKTEKNNKSTSTEPYTFTFLDTLMFRSIYDAFSFHLLVTCSIGGMIGVKMKNTILHLPWLAVYMFMIINFYIHCIFLFVDNKLTEGVVCILHGIVYISIWIMVRYVFKDIKRDNIFTDRESKMTR